MHTSEKENCHRQPMLADSWSIQNYFFVMFRFESGFRHRSGLSLLSPPPPPPTSESEFFLVVRIQIRHQIKRNINIINNTRWPWYLTAPTQKKTSNRERFNQTKHVYIQNAFIYFCTFSRLGYMIYKLSYINIWCFFITSYIFLFSSSKIDIIVYAFTSSWEQIKVRCLI